MIPYKKLKQFYDEIIEEHKLIDKYNKKQTKLFKDKLENDDEFSDFCKEHPNLFKRIVDKNYKVSLNKIIPNIMKLHKTSTAKSTLLKKNFPVLYEQLKTKSIDTLYLLKTIRNIKLKYEEQLSLNNEHSKKEYERLTTKYKDKYPQIHESNPTLYNGTINKTLDKNTLEKMISMYKLFYEKKISNHDASVQFGTVLVDKFIKPHLKK